MGLAMTVSATDERIRVMVVDDSVVVRGLISRTLEAMPDITVVATAGNGQHAADQIGRRPIDVVILDIEMPVMDGLTALPLMLERCPGVRVIVASGLSARNAEISLKALESGAVDYIPKPGSSHLTTGHDGEAFAQELIQKVRIHGGHRTADEPPRHAPPRVRPAVEPGKTAPAAGKGFSLRAPSPVTPSVLAVGSSTGGPQALFRFFRTLGPYFPLPILIVQHMPATFTSILAGHISTQSGVACREAKDSDPLIAGQALLAPGNFHMIVDGNGGKPVVRINQNSPENFCRPAVDPLFRSVAAVYGPRALGVVLTGMGSDGLRGGRVLIESGGTLLAQDEESSVVWGMPGAVANANLCSAVGPVETLAKHVHDLAEGKRK